MKQEDRVELARLLKWYGTSRIIENLLDCVKKEAQDYPSNAIIHDHLTILTQTHAQCVELMSSRLGLSQ